MSTRKTEILIAALDASDCMPRRFGDRWRSKCPSHGSRGGTLLVDADGGFHCFAGCDGSDVLSALGLRWSDLSDPNVEWQPRKREPKRVPTYQSPVAQALAFGCDLTFVGEGVYAGSCPCGGLVSAGPFGVSCSNGCPVGGVGQFLRDLNDARLLRKEVVVDKKVLEILMCSIERQGVSQKTGKAWTLYRVQANDAQGNPISEKLQAFQELPVGRGEYEVERREHPEYGVSFTVKAPSAFSRRIDELEARIAKLEAAQVPSSAPVADPVPF